MLFLMDGAEFLRRELGVVVRLLCTLLTGKPLESLHPTRSVHKLFVFINFFQAFYCLPINQSAIYHHFAILGMLLKMQLV